MMPPNYDYSNPPKLYMSNGTNLTLFDRIPTLQLSPADDSDMVYRPFENTSFEFTMHLCPIRTRVWHMLLGWRGRAALRPRNRQRMKAWNMTGRTTEA